MFIYTSDSADDKIALKQRPEILTAKFKVNRRNKQEGCSLGPGEASQAIVTSVITVKSEIKNSRWSWGTIKRNLETKKTFYWRDS